MSLVKALAKAAIGIAVAKGVSGMMSGGQSRGQGSGGGSYGGGSRYGGQSARGSATGAGSITDVLGKLLAGDGPRGRGSIGGALEELVDLARLPLPTTIVIGPGGAVESVVQGALDEDTHAPR